MDDRPRWRISTLLIAGAAAGLATGLGGYAFLESQRLLLDKMVFLGAHALWMKPLVEAALSVTVLVIAALALRAIGRRLDLRAAVFISGTLAALSGLFLIPPLHPIARWLLALGFGAQLARVLSRRLWGHEGQVRKAGLAILGTVGLVAALGLTIGSISRERAVADRAPASGDPANVLLLVLDTVRARSLSLYGYARPTTPELEQFSSNGVVFDRAYAPAPWTLPSHASMFTGREPHQHNADWRQPLSDRHETLASHLRTHGYETFGAVANMSYAGWETGLDRGFDRYLDHPVSWRQVLAESPVLGWIIDHPRVRELVGTDENFVRKEAAEVNASFLSWLDRRNAPRPFFAFLNYYDAHGPYQPAEPYRTRFARGTPRGRLSPLHRFNSDPFGPLPGPEAIAQEQDAYDAAIAWLDAELGRLFDQLEERDLMGETLVVVTSDHGEEFGVHGVFDHANSIYVDNLHVPLVARFDGRLPAGRVTHAVSLTDLASTVHDLLGFSDRDPFSGRSVLDGPRGEPVLSTVSFAARLPDWFPISSGDMASLADARWHYIRDGNGDEELYDLSADPDESDDLAESRVETLLRMRSHLPDPKQ